MGTLKFRETATKTLSCFMSIRIDGVDYQVRLDNHYARVKELSNAIRNIDATDIGNKYKEETVNWAIAEYR